MRLLAIDPGTTESGWVLLWDGNNVADAGVMDNVDLRNYMPDMISAGLCDQMAIEMVASYGMAVGKEVFRTVWWAGRFADAWLSATGNLPVEIYRQDVKLHLCKNPRAKDANIRQALIDLIGPQGTKKAPGPTYRVKSHAWAALGVAATAMAKTA